MQFSLKAFLFGTSIVLSVPTQASATLLFANGTTLNFSKRVADLTRSTLSGRMLPAPQFTSAEADSEILFFEVTDISFAGPSSRPLSTTEGDYAFSDGRVFFQQNIDAPEPTSTILMTTKGVLVIHQDGTIDRQPPHTLPLWDMAEALPVWKALIGKEELPFRMNRIARTPLEGWEPIQSAILRWIWVTTRDGVGIPPQFILRNLEKHRTEVRMGLSAWVTTSNAHKVTLGAHFSVYEGHKYWDQFKRISDGISPHLIEVIGNTDPKKYHGVASLDRMNGLQGITLFRPNGVEVLGDYANNGYFHFFRQHWDSARTYAQEKGYELFFNDFYHEFPTGFENWYEVRDRINQAIQLKQATQPQHPNVPGDNLLSLRFCKQISEGKGPEG